MRRPARLARRAALARPRSKDDPCRAGGGFRTPEGLGQWAVQGWFRAQCAPIDNVSSPFAGQCESVMFPGPLRVFHEVVRAGSIRKASEAMEVSASSVSRQLAILERQIGTKLAERSAGGITLTHAGQLVADYARRVVLEFDSLKIDLDDMRGRRRRLIRIAAVESVVAAGPSKAMAEFRQRYDEVTFQLVMLPAPQVLEAVRKNNCDIGLAMNPQPDPAIRTLAMVEEPIVLAAPQGHPLFGRSSVSLEEALAHELAAPDESFGIRRIVDRAAHAEGRGIHPVISTNTFEALRDFARVSGVAAILPKRAVHNRPGDPELRAIPILSDPLTGGAIHVIAHREQRMPRIISLFADLLIIHIRNPA